MEAKLQTLAHAALQKAQHFIHTTLRKGENFELKSELNSEYEIRRREAVKRVIANMTIGKDVSGLFADVVKNMQTENREMKKLVYLYLINYAKTQPELVILAVNTFIKDTDDINPLIRALAIRTMGCLRVSKIIDYISEPLRKTLADSDPYVRKTAAICVAKLYDVDAQCAIDNGFLDTLANLLGDGNPVVVANAVAALSEIAIKSEVSPVSDKIITKLLSALNDCTEWGQITILEALMTYEPPTPKDAEAVVERVTPRLAHRNAGVVMGAVRVLIRMLPRLENGDAKAAVIKKLTAPLVTLLSSDSEICYIALRSILLILQNNPEYINAEMRAFFCKYNDPQYVKMEKIAVMEILCSEKNVDVFLGELKEYCTEVDVQFVRRSIGAIGCCALKVETSAERCINLLLDLVRTKINYVVQEAVIVIKNIFRKYPNRYEGIIPVLCENTNSLDEPEAKAAMIWILGEYAERIDNALQILSDFMEGFKFDSVQVQIQILTAAVKLFLKRPEVGQDLVQKVLQASTAESENADLRDRAYIYWRLLSIDPNVTKSIVLATKPPLSLSGSHISKALLTELVQQIGLLSSVYHHDRASFLSSNGEPIAALPVSAETGAPESDGQGATAVGDLLDLDWGADPAASSQAVQANAIAGLAGLDMLGPGFASPSSMHAAPLQSNTTGLDDLFGSSPMGQSSFPTQNSLGQSNASSAKPSGGDNLDWML